MEGVGGTKLTRKMQSKQVVDSNEVWKLPSWKGSSSFASGFPAALQQFLFLVRLLWA